MNIPRDHEILSDTGSGRAGTLLLEVLWESASRAIHMSVKLAYRTNNFPCHLEITEQGTHRVTRRRSIDNNCVVASHKRVPRYGFSEMRPEH
jgi:hypothetical protein